MRQAARTRTARRILIAGIASLTLLGLAGCGTASTPPINPLTGNSSASVAGSGSANTPVQNADPGSNSSSSQMNALNQTPRPMKLVRSGHQVKIDMYTEETKVQIAPGVFFPAWTFDGTVPGPVIELQQGDHVTLTLHNLDPNMSHSIDLHAALVAPNQEFVDVAPGKTRTLSFDAAIPGVFMYHCATMPMPLHIAQGMYGAVVVTAPGQLPPTYTIVQSEFYNPMDLSDVDSGKPNYIVFNGQAERYVTTPLTAKVGQSVTVAFVNAGPNEWSAFHVVGTVLRRVEASGNPKNNLYDVQTYTVAPGDGMLATLQFNSPGLYAFVSHSTASYDKGAVGKFDVSK